MSVIWGAHSGQFDGEDEHTAETYRPSERAPWRAYGMTDEEFGAMYREQAGHCAICQDETRLNVDHDHVTGKVRGLLCHRCNVALGWLQDDSKVAEAMALYLESHG